MSNLKKEMHERIDSRMNKLKIAAERLHRQIDKGVLGGEEARMWLDQYAIGKGLNFAVGDFSIGDSEGVDGDFAKIGADWHVDFEDVPLMDGQLDHIVSNYLECVSHPLRMLEDWSVRLKKGGVVAIVCRDADAYNDSGDARGPLSNPRRRSCFNLTTLSYYLNAAGFSVLVYERFDKELRIAATKN